MKLLNSLNNSMSRMLWCIEPSYRIDKTTGFGPKFFIDAISFPFIDKDKLVR